MKNLIKRIGQSCLIANVVLGFITLSLFAQPPDGGPRKIVVFQEEFVN